MTQLEPVSYKRGDKSLAELSSRFLRDLWARTNHVINLETLTVQLGNVFGLRPCL